MPTLEQDVQAVQSGAPAGPDESSIKLTCHHAVYHVYTI
jgi:hypothetical protein